MFYYKNFKEHKIKIRQVLNRINLLHTDCQRDFYLAQALGFKRKFTEIIPGGGGYDLRKFTDLIEPFEDRKIILVKGYEHQFGRAIKVIQALSNIDDLDKNIDVVIFGSHQKLIDYLLENNLKYQYYGRHELSQSELMKLMGSSLIYIGNSISDGIPNTLIESIIMQAFPIQSNPGNATSEIIENKKNGLLIKNPEDENEIKEKILFALNNRNILINAMYYNKLIVENKFDFNSNKKKIISIYSNLI